jgi:hypothetical protein
VATVSGLSGFDVSLVVAVSRGTRLVTGRCAGALGMIFDVLVSVTRRDLVAGSRVHGPRRDRAEGHRPRRLCAAADTSR